MLPLNTMHALERAVGIEPSFPAWQAGVLPLNYASFETLII